MPQHAIFKIGSSVLFHYALFPMARHVALSPAGMNQGREGVKPNESRGENKESIVKLHTTSSEPACCYVFRREATKSLSPASFVNQGAREARSSSRERLQTPFDQTVLRGRKIGKEGPSKRCYP